MSESLIQIVNEDDEPVRGGTMDEAQLNGLWHRIVRVMVTDGSGNWLLQKVPDDAFYYGGQWNTSASGHVDEGESYDTAARRELFEETGIRAGYLAEVEYFRTRHTMPPNRTFVRWNTTYTTMLPPNTNLAHDDEIAELRWFSRDELLKLLGEQASLVTAGLSRFVKNYKDEVS